ncbi:sulfite exporter TauE/SafE family protein [Solibacillus sp. FSL K6-1781]|uniref:sulfite exporter TauE/SafE family protein n=1 Tax=Solibacillus sp. FSL K6-1781 TaxID=2921474 RepID=UPI00156319E4|nr:MULTISPECIES: sulfite exporter TauE/SafE family protein [Solibacillus]
MDLSFMYIAVIFGLGFIGSFLSGMLGVGGSIIKYPLLLYIPPMFGLVAFTAHEVSGISAVQVLFASLAGVWAYRKSGLLNRELIIYMGVAILIGSFIGSYGSGFLSEDAVNIVYGLLAAIAAVMMFIPKKTVENTTEITFNKVLASSLALIVGIGSGIVGAAGGFLLVPIMLTVLKIPTRITIATSLAITFISSIGGSVGKVMTGQVDYWPAFIMIIASIIAAPLGAKVGQKMNVKMLQWLLAIMIGATAIKIWIDILL